MTTAGNLQQLFALAYDRTAWLAALHSLLPSIDVFLSPQSIDDAQAQRFDHLGKAKTADGKTLGIYEIQTKPETQLHRNRVQMRQLVAKQCQQSALDGALAVYVGEQEQWRFSFISMKYRLNEQGQINKEESAPTRYTYLLGTGANVRTAVERFSRLNKTATLNDLKTAFAVEQLNKEFYEKLFEWYEHAKSQVVFPNDEREETDTHVSTSLIRLLTRLLFVWFLKEKELVNRDFFACDKVRQMIDWNKESGYYKAILQNLFFATLNREINDRSFRTTTNGKANSNNYLVTNIYRYRDYFQDNNTDTIIAHFAQTPFLNGGLFECLDREATEKEQAAYDLDTSSRINRSAIRIDGFSDKDSNPLQVPNQLFFNNDEQPPGLIDLLNRYQFTVEESTPLDVDVALDPELLGLVFENLLASYNPETQQTARKASGSYYTPREIVTYMVDETLKAYFVQTCGLAEETINRLFQADLVKNEFTKDERATLIRAIDTIKIIDPAVGSGAFPMGILQRFVQILGIVDPENTQWKRRQTDIIDQLPDSESREQALKEVETIFNEKNRFNDFGRKLYLIEKCIYGVDVQPIAIQIAKLRFFISLAIEQQADGDKDDNYGIKPLPNLETRFVAANSLIGLDKPRQTAIRNPAIQKKEQALNQVRRRHFNAKTLTTKRQCRKQDKTLREEIAALLVNDGWGDSNAQKIAHWDPYNQHAVADWFDPEWMFGVNQGFDVVIGNPPYVESRNSLLTFKLKEAYRSQVLADWGDTLPRGSDLLVYFYPRAAKFLSNQGGMGCFIMQNAWLSTDYGKKFQDFSLGRFSFERIIDTSAKFFSDVKSQNINAVITMFTGEPLDKIAYGVADADMVVTPVRTIAAKQEMKWGHVFSMPPFFAYILEHLRSASRKESPFAFGQGLNFPMAELRDPDATVPIIVRDSGFVATSADGMIREVRTSRTRKVPALVMPRGVGSRYYCTFNLCKAYSYSHVELYLPAELWDTDTHYCLWAYLNSSLVWLFREITGRKNLGGGMLKAEATEMKALPINFGFDFAEQARQVFQDIQDRKPLPVQEEIYTQEHLRIDAVVADCLGFADKQDDIRNTLVEQVSFRLSRAIR